MLVKTMGAEAFGPPDTADNGIRLVDSLLVEAGLSPDSLRLEDGSGLSRFNQIAPDHTVRLLAYLYRRFDIHPEFMASLPVGGIDGTLEERFQDTSLVRRVRAKTGTLSGASALSGYVATERGDVLVFSIMMQGYLGPSGPVRDVQDAMVALFREF
jgi:D-alanyl-D-alanine carboxypeptidase/D-alanyl-D-alanine-endopeptidase (penicillin-binding protein 4)